jgi:hypothetical protein
MNKALFAVLALAFSAAAQAENPSDRVFNDAVRDINEAVGKIISKQSPLRATQKAQTGLGAAAQVNACTPAQADAAYQDIARCEDAMRKAQGVEIKDYKGRLYTGFQPNGLVLLTTTDAYFYSEPCDICAELTRCSLKDGKLSTQIAAHSVSCADVAPLTKGATIVFNACAPKKP